MYLPRMLIKPVNTLFDGKKSGFVHIISLTKSAVYAIIKKVAVIKAKSKLYKEFSTLKLFTINTNKLRKDNI